MARVFSLGQIQAGAPVVSRAFRRGLLGCWLYRDGFKRARDLSGNHLNIAERNSTNSNASLGLGKYGRTYKNAGAVFDAPWCTDRDIAPPLNVTYCCISRSTNSSYPSSTSETSC